MLNVLTVGTAIALVGLGCGRGSDVVVVGSKNFTESILLGEIVAQALEGRGVQVVRKHNLNGSFVCHQAMVAGEMDIYVEYTGTAHSAILELPTARNPEVVRSTVDSIYRERWGIEWADPLGFNNTFAMLVRGEMARGLDIRSLSEAVDHARTWRAGFGFEFIGRADGLDGLRDWYGLEFLGEPAAMDLTLTYRALAEGTVDIIAGNSTDGQIDVLDLFHLEDDKGYFPPYEAIPIVRTAALQAHPVIKEALESIAGTINEAQMREMNRLVDADGRSIEDVASGFLQRVASR